MRYNEIRVNVNRRRSVANTSACGEVRQLLRREYDRTRWQRRAGRLRERARRIGIRVRLARRIGLRARLRAPAERLRVRSGIGARERLRLAATGILIALLAALLSPRSVCHRSPSFLAEVAPSVGSGVAGATRFFFDQGSSIIFAVRTTVSAAKDEFSHSFRSSRCTPFS